LQDKKTSGRCAPRIVQAKFNGIRRLEQSCLWRSLLAGAHQRGINTAIETASNVPWDFMAKVLPHVDTVLHDIKLTDPERHKKWTGVNNTRIRANLKLAYETFPDKKFIARTALIPGVNDDE
jgi:pyruvate formate lyase activating enzyme